MKITQEHILIEPIKEKEKNGLIVAGPKYIAGKVLDVGALIDDDIDSKDIVIFEQDDIQQITYNSKQYKYIHKSKVVLFEKNK